MNKVYNLILILVLLVAVQTNADAQLRRIYNEQQLIMLELNGTLNTINDNQINNKAKKSKVYQRFLQLNAFKEETKTEKKKNKTQK